jgi:hypothetical protein
MVVRIIAAECFAPAQKFSEIISAGSHLLSEMASTILSSLGETVLHRNSLATVTDSWIVVREVESHKQMVVSIGSISAVKTFKTFNIYYFACGVGAILIALAAAGSKEPSGATLPFLVIGTALLLCAQFTRRASLALIADEDTVQTAFGTLSEAATLVTAIRSANQGNGRRERRAYNFLLWLRSYLTLLV